MEGPLEILATGLGHPEGPDVLPDARIVFVETFRSRISAWSADSGAQEYAYCGGGPNACMLGSDAVYVTQNGGTVGLWRAERMVPPSIQKVWADGRVETVATEVDGLPLRAPNDMTFGPDGRLYFTDPADYRPDDPRCGRVFGLNRDGTGILLAELPESYPNGIACEAMGSLVFVESYKRQVFRMTPGEPPTLIHQFPEDHVPDGLKIDENGNLWITTYSSHGVDIIAKDGSPLGFIETGGIPMNCVFDRDSLIVCNLGDVDVRDRRAAPVVGRLERLSVGVRGMPLFRGAVE
jgi:gluconolactonase